MALLSGATQLEADELAEVKAGAKRGRSGFAQAAIDEFLTLPKTKQRMGIEVPLSNFNTDGATRTVKAVVSGINTRAISTDAPVWAKASKKFPDSRIVLFYGQHEKTGPRQSNGDGAGQS